MAKKSILLIYHGNFDEGFLEEIAKEVAHEFHCAVNIETSHIDLNTFYDAERRQYDANSLVKMIDSMFPFQYLKKIGLFRVDLFIPILTYIFGQAILKGNTGVASLYRLRNEQYGMEKDEALLLERFKKVIIHELGHTFGLIHCHVPDCVMRSTTYVEEIDQKKQQFCKKCREELEQAMNNF